MGNTNKRKASKVNDIKTLAEATTILAPAVISVAEKLGDALKNQFSDRNSRKKPVIVPTIYGGEHRSTIDEAEELLSDRGLLTRVRAVHLEDASVKYRDCIDYQVVDSEPKPKSKVDAGGTVTVWYVTQEVIDKSQRIFDEEQKRKSEVKKLNVKKRTRFKKGRETP